MSFQALSQMVKMMLGVNRGEQSFHEITWHLRVPLVTLLVEVSPLCSSPSFLYNLSSKNGRSYIPMQACTKRREGGRRVGTAITHDFKNFYFLKS